MIEYPRYKNVLFCTDFSRNSDCAFDYAFGVAKRDGSTLHLLHVIPDVPNPYYAAIHSHRESFKKIQEAIDEEIAEKFEKHYLSQVADKSSVRTATRSGREDEEILKFAREQQVDIIVMGTHGRTGINHLLIGSVAERTIRRSPVPVFVIPCPEA